jgi:hypothetical protein
MFKGRKLLIATKHQKEQVIAPLLEDNLKVFCVLNSGFDSDVLGTFSGEIERKLDVIETLRQKCLIALQNTNYDLVVASEGSFGVHPTLFFAAADDEFMMFKDLKNNIEIVARCLSTETNFDGIAPKNQNELEDFAKKVQFPSHGIILKSSKKNPEIIIKDVENLSELTTHFHDLKKNYSGVFAETDMRAHKNPTRMKVIKEVAEKLIEKINSFCPSCQFPGFDVVQIHSGLPCSLCGMKTKSTLSHKYACSNCNYEEGKYLPFDKKWEDPMYCDFCNP